MPDSTEYYATEQYTAYGIGIRVLAGSDVAFTSADAYYIAAAMQIIFAASPALAALVQSAYPNGVWIYIASDAVTTLPIGSNAAAIPFPLTVGPIRGVVGANVPFVGSHVNIGVRQSDIALEGAATIAHELVGHAIYWAAFPTQAIRNEVARIFPPVGVGPLARRQSEGFAVVLETYLGLSITPDILWGVARGFGRGAADQAFYRQALTPEQLRVFQWLFGAGGAVPSRSTAPNSTPGLWPAVRGATGAAGAVPRSGSPEMQGPEPSQDPKGDPSPLSAYSPNVYAWSSNPYSTSPASPPSPDDSPPPPDQPPDDTGASGVAPLGPDPSSMGASPFGSVPQAQPAAPGASPATSPEVFVDGGTTLPSIDAPTTAVDALLQAFSDLGLDDLPDLSAQLGWILSGGIDFLPPAPPPPPTPDNTEQSGPDNPEDDPPPPPDGSDGSSVYAAGIDTGGMISGDPPDDPGPPGMDWEPIPKGDPPEDPPGGYGSPPPQWPGYSPSPGDPMSGVVTGSADPGGIGAMWDEALGAAAALAQALPSARSQITAALQAFFAAHPGSAPPDWLEGLSLLGSLPPGMTLGEYLQQHAQYQVEPGQTYARVGGPAPSTGPGDPVSPVSPVGGAGPGAGGGEGGSGGAVGGAGDWGTDTSSPWDPTDNLGAGRGSSGHIPGDPPSV
jgi:hypothetical protein